MVRANFYPPWRAFADGREVGSSRGRPAGLPALPASGSYIVRLEYPRYRGLSILAILALVGGAIALASWPRGSQLPARS